MPSPGDCRLPHVLLFVAPNQIRHCQRRLGMEVGQQRSRNGRKGPRWVNRSKTSNKDPFKLCVYSGPGTEAKPDVGKGKNYQVPEYFQYNKYSFHDVEMDMAKGRVPQPKSGLSEFWGGSGKQ